MPNSTVPLNNPIIVCVLFIIVISIITGDELTTWRPLGDGDGNAVGYIYATSAELLKIATFFGHMYVRIMCWMYPNLLLSYWTPVVPVFF